jgi:pimeloyl-ACP methyl ester carboxylesterase
MTRQACFKEKEMTSATTQTGKATLEYQWRERLGRPTLVFLHGLGANQTQFNHQLDFFASDYQLVTLNVRGHGRSYC